MEVGGLCIKFLVHVLVLLCAHVQDVDSLILHLEPNRQQFFEYESLTFHCEGAHYSTGLKIVHQSKGELPKCEITETSTRSSCNINSVFPEDSGHYWCESGDGKISNVISITVSAGHVILESPISVVEGNAVTLNCRHKTNSSILPTDFFKDGRLIKRSPTRNMRIPAVSKSDEGFYKCNISGIGESVESLMAVEVLCEVNPENQDEGSSPWIVTVTVLLVLLLLVGLLHLVKSYWNRVLLYLSTLAPQSGATELQTVSVEAGREAADAGQPMYAVVTKDRTKKVSVEAGREAADAGQPTYAVVKNDRKKKVQAESSTEEFYSTLGDTQQLEPGASTIPTLTVRSARTDRPLTRESFYSTIH